MSKVFRKEIKYPITNLDFFLLRKRLECFVQPDPHSGDDGYRVRSLYFDSNDDQDLLDSLNGNMEKRKIRLRFYPPDTKTIKLEYKCKSGIDGIKHSIKLSKEEAERIIAGDYSLLLNIGSPLALELYARLMLGAYQPKVIVEYHRLAYSYPVNNNRITFDSKVAASNVVHSFFDHDLGLIPLMEPDAGVLEVKYDQFLVGVLKDVVRSVDSLAKANSKYAQSRLLFI